MSKEEEGFFDAQESHTQTYYAVKNALMIMKTTLPRGAKTEDEKEMKAGYIFGIDTLITMLVRRRNKGGKGGYIPTVVANPHARPMNLKGAMDPLRTEEYINTEAPASGLDANVSVAKGVGVLCGGAAAGAEGSPLPDPDKEWTTDGLEDLSIDRLRAMLFVACLMYACKGLYANARVSGKYPCVSQSGRACARDGLATEQSRDILFRHERLSSDSDIDDDPEIELNYDLYMMQEGKVEFPINADESILDYVKRLSENTHLQELARTESYEHIDNISLLISAMMMSVLYAYGTVDPQSPPLRVRFDAETKKD